MRASTAKNSKPFKKELLVVEKTISNRRDAKERTRAMTNESKLVAFLVSAPKKAVLMNGSPRIDSGMDSDMDEGQIDLGSKFQNKEKIEFKSKMSARPMQPFQKSDSLVTFKQKTPVSPSIAWGDLMTDGPRVSKNSKISQIKSGSQRTGSTSVEETCKKAEENLSDDEACEFSQAQVEGFRLTENFLGSEKQMKEWSNISKGSFSSQNSENSQSSIRIESSARNHHNPFYLASNIAGNCFNFASIGDESSESNQGRLDTPDFFRPHEFLKGKRQPSN